MHPAFIYRLQSQGCVQQPGGKKGLSTVAKNVLKPQKWLVSVTVRLPPDIFFLLGPEDKPVVE